MTSQLSGGNRPQASPLALVRSLWRNRHLLLQLVRRDVASRYRGSFAGLLWSLALPCAMLGIYVVVFGYIFVPARAVGQGGPDLLFSLTLFSGLLIHGLLAECLTRAPTAILAQPSYVKKVVFPLELLPLTVVGTAAVQFVIGSSVLIGALIIVRGLSISALLWPLAWLPLLALSAGVAFIVSALTVYLRDLAQFTGFMATLLLFMSPIFYPLASAPAAIQKGLIFNPLTIPIETSRELLISGQFPASGPWFAHLFGCLLVLWLGWWLFQRMRRGFADVI